MADFGLLAGEMRTFPALLVDAGVPAGLAVLDFTGAFVPAGFAGPPGRLAALIVVFPPAVLTLFAGAFVAPTVLLMFVLGVPVLDAGVAGFFTAELGSAFCCPDPVTAFFGAFVAFTAVLPGRFTGPSAAMEF